jgi:transcription elongation factor GreA
MTTKTAHLNSKVTVKCNDVVRTYQLVRSEELGTGASKISEMSPLGKLLLGSKTKDVIKVKTPSGTVEYKVVSVET